MADFDQDGYVEVALTKSTGSLLKIYESPANDTWIEELTIATVQEANQMEGATTSMAMGGRSYW